MSRAPRRTLGTYGAKGRTVRVFTEGDLVRVQWREGGLLRTRSWANTPSHRADAKAWAKGFAEARDAAPLAPARVTLRALWEAYQLAEFAHLRARSQVIYRDGWRKWEQAWGPDFAAEDATPQMLDSFRRSLEGAGLAVNTVRMAIRVIKTVHAFGDRRELLQRNRLASWRYKLAKERRPTPPPEYREDEFSALLGALDPAKQSQWRAYVALALCGYQGARQHAVLHLRWDDVDLGSGWIRWRAEWDKTGKDWGQPMREGTRRALEAALRWHTARGTPSPWVIPAPRGDGPYSKQSLWWMLRTASRRAGVAVRRGRGAHGLRRMVAGDVAALTGNVALALQSIGDTSLQMASRYVQTRETEVAAAFRALDRARDTAPDRNASVIGNENAPAEAEAESYNSLSGNHLEPEGPDAP